MSSAVSTPHGIHPPMKLSSFESIHPKPASVVHSQADKDCSVGDEPEILSVSWNQDYGCFAVGTTCGFQIYDCDPFKETFRRNLRGGGFGIVEMIFRSNLLALVGGGKNTQYPPNKVLLWDDHQGRCFGEFAFRSTVRAVRLRQDRLVVVLEHRIYVYNLVNLKLLHQIETLANPRGLCCLSHGSITSVLACPGLRQGQVRVEHFGPKVTKIITAHDSKIACFTLTHDGLLLATASTKGTLIRIFNTVDGTRLQEVRRGAERAEIYSIAFSPSVQRMVVSSDKGTIHIFNLRVRVGCEDAPNPSSQGSEMGIQNSSTIDLVSLNPGSNTSSSLSFMKGVLPKYFSSEWSFAQFHLPEVTRYVAAFGAQNTALIIGLNGSFYRCSFDPVNGGTMVQKEYVRF